MTAESNYIVVGIDIGSTYCSVFYYNPTSKKYESIQFVGGSESLPSCLSLKKEGGVLKFNYGLNAKGDRGLCLFRDIKRFAGRKFTSEGDQADYDKDVFNWEFDIGEDKNEYPDEEEKVKKDNIVLVTHDYSDGTEYAFRPEELICLLLKHIVSQVKEKTHKDVSGVCVGVPVGFNDEQRKAIALAVKLAGLKLINITNEPEASLYTYQEYLKSQKKKETLNNVVVLDLGGGTFDLTCLKKNGNKHRVIATCGDNKLGGNDFDAVMIEMIQEELENNCDDYRDLCKKKSNRQTGKEKKALKIIKTRIRNEAERIKIEFSTKGTESEDVNTKEIFDNIGLEGDFDCDASINKDEYFDKCEDLIKKCEDQIDELLRQMKIFVPPMMVTQVNKVILAGSASKLPIFRQMVAKKFVKKELLTGEEFRSDVSVAKGLAIKANNVASLNMDDDIIPAVPHSLGMEVRGGEVVHFIKQGNNLPLDKTIVGKIPKAQNELLLAVWEGESVFTETDGMNCLGSVVVGIKPVPRSEVGIKVYCKVKVDGTIEVKCEADEGTTIKGELKAKFDYDKGDAYTILKKHLKALFPSFN